MASVELVSIEKRFGDLRIVKGVSLSIEQGEFLVLVGPSGCGKSTCLRMIAGLEEVTAGEIRIGGRTVNDVPPKDRDIGMVFQSYALYPHMSVYENLAFGLTLRRVPKAEIEERVQEAARMLELGSLLQRKPRELSGGQRQRVAMGRAIVRRPQVFLFDEPLSNLDAALRVQMRAELSALHRRLGATMVYVTHDQVEAMTLASRIAVLEAGVLQQVGPALELYHRPANRFVAGFIGSPAMNFVAGRLMAHGEGAVFEAQGIRVPIPPSAAARALGDGAVTLGVRPHDLALGEGVAGEVEVVEPMGWEAFVHVRIGKERLVARLEGRDAASARAGDRVSLRIDPARVHLFGADGASILSPSQAEAPVPVALVAGAGVGSTR